MNSKLQTLADALQDALEMEQKEREKARRVLIAVAVDASDIIAETSGKVLGLQPRRPDILNEVRDLLRGHEKTLTSLGVFAPVLAAKLETRRAGLEARVIEALREVS